MPLPLHPPLTSEDSDTETEVTPDLASGATEAPSGSEEKKKWCGFKIVGDNIDKSVNPRHQTMDRQKQSLHYFHSFAVLDRVDLSGLSDECPKVDIKSFPVESLLPSDEDVQAISDNFAILIGRILVDYLPELSFLASASIRHIKHKYSAEMSKESHVVCQYNNTHVCIYICTCSY